MPFEAAMLDPRWAARQGLVRDAAGTLRLTTGTATRASAPQAAPADASDQPV
jgi:hypothetical protein